MEPPFHQVEPFLGLYTEALKSVCCSYAATSIFIAAQLTIAKIWNQMNCSLTNEWTMKLWYIFTVEYFSDIKKLWHLQVNG